MHLFITCSSVSLIYGEDPVHVESAVVHLLLLKREHHLGHGGRDPTELQDEGGERMEGLELLQGILGGAEMLGQARASSRSEGAAGGAGRCRDGRGVAVGRELQLGVQNL